MFFFFFASIVRGKKIGKNPRGLNRTYKDQGFSGFHKAHC